MISAQISCIVTVYSGTSVDELHDCLNSIYTQKAVLPSELIICFDGVNCFSIVDHLIEPPPSIDLKTVYLWKNSGPGHARHISVLFSSEKYIAIMDSDDICRPTRFSSHYQAFSSGADFHTGQLSILNSASNKVNLLRNSAANSFQFYQQVKYRTPFNNQTLAFSRHLYLRCGGYPNLRVAEDWVLMARMYPYASFPIISDDVLVSFRENINYVSRRSGYQHAICEFKASAYVSLLGLSGVHWPIFVLLSRLLFRFLLPAKFLHLFEHPFRSLSKK
ncbi:glycosyltransferase [bacterium]|nr:glycosyltransferase [bacterium]